MKLINTSTHYVRIMFLDAFTKFRKANISFVMSVRLTVRKKSVPPGRIFMKFYIWAFFENLSTKFKFH